MALVLVTLAILAAWRPAADHARAARILQRFAAGGDAHGALTEEDVILDDGARGRLYTPISPAAARGIVLVPGVHHLGIDEPRLVRFARAIAANGVPVLTPEVAALADYRIDAASADTIGRAAQWYRARTGATVGLLGMSFAGGLALLAAADPRFADSVAFVVAVGAHDDLARVARFFATDAIARPDGTVLAMHAHPYGPLVLVYAHVEDFFPAGDVATARDALRLWLWERRDEARAHEAALSAASRKAMDALFDDHLEGVTPALLAEIDRRADAMRAASPHDRIGSIRCPVLLLHGAGDTVIPPSETLWLAADAPAPLVQDVLVSPAILHVEMEGEPTWRDRLALIHFMAILVDDDRR